MFMDLFIILISIFIFSPAISSWNINAIIYVIIVICIDLIIWTHTSRLVSKWLDYLYIEKNLDIEFERMMLSGFAWCLPGLILFIEQMRTKSFRNYLRLWYFL